MGFKGIAVQKPKKYTKVAQEQYRARRSTCGVAVAAEELELSYYNKETTS